jgi:sRNA-binding regulator protein Hfq
VRICTLIGLKLVLFSLVSVLHAQDALVPAVPTAVPVTAKTTSGASTTVPRSSGTIARKLQPQSVTVALLNGMKLSGELTEVDQWNMKTSFGTTNLPLSTVAGMRMAQEGNAITTVVLHNGDNLTGAVQLDQVVIQTEWGRAEINGNHVASILFTPGLKWISETGLNGMRWKLVTDEPPKPAAAPGQPGQPGQPRPGFQQPGVRQ